MASFGNTAGTAGAMAPNDHQVSSPGNDGTSGLSWSPSANILVSSNWDGAIRCWEVQEQGGQIRANPKAQGKKIHVRVQFEETVLRSTAVSFA